MSSNLYVTARTGLTVATTRMDVAASNIANADTPRYRRKEVVATALPEGGVQAKVQASPQQGGADLSRDIVTQLSGSYSYKANLQVLKTADDMTGTLLDTMA